MNSDCRFRLQSRVTVQSTALRHILPAISNVWFRMELSGALRHKTPVLPVRQSRQTSQKEPELHGPKMRRFAPNTLSHTAQSARRTESGIRSDMTRYMMETLNRADWPRLIRDTDMISCLAWCEIWIVDWITCSEVPRAPPTLQTQDKVIKCQSCTARHGRMQ